MGSWKRRIITTQHGVLHRVRCAIGESDGNRGDAASFSCKITLPPDSQGRLFHIHTFTQFFQGHLMKTQVITLAELGYRWPNERTKNATA